MSDFDFQTGKEIVDAFVAKGAKADPNETRMAAVVLRAVIRYHAEGAYIAAKYMLARSIEYGWGTDKRIELRDRFMAAIGAGQCQT